MRFRAQPKCYNTLMSYLAILGRTNSLSLAELEAVLGSEAVTPISQHALLTKEPRLVRLCGTIKIARVIAEAKSWDETLLGKVISNLPSGPAKLTIGLSYYGRAQLLRVGMQ